MKRFSLFLLLGLLLVSLFLFSGCTGPEAGIKIGIMQILDHTALNAARDSFIEALSDEGFVEGDNITLDIQNAHGEITTASTIAEGFVADKVDLILAIATPTAQAAYNATKDIPIVITAVTDPVSTGLAESLERPGANVTGTHDMNPVKLQLELLLEIIPEATRIGVIFNSSEENSVIQVGILEEEISQAGLTLIKAPVTATGDVLTAAESLVGEVDAIYVPTDNTAVSAIDSVLQVSEEHLIPVIAGEDSCVRNGALATIGIDYSVLGYQTGLM
ncbi:MAG: ABC transporter substrate-binding protein, partial [Firmicutes bacterium]|nr:ABC transporter substrate-binding protein [Bacillota bacterium]